MQIIMFVLDNPNQLDDVLDAWNSVGIRGITLIESIGFHRRLAYVLGMRYVGGDSSLVEYIEEGHYTLFATARDVPTVHQCLSVTEQIVGDLDRLNTGIFLAWEATFAKGMPNRLDYGEQGE